MVFTRDSLLSSPSKINCCLGRSRHESAALAGFRVAKSFRVGAEPPPLALSP